MKHSYIIRNKQNKKAVYEFFDCRLIDKVNTVKYEVITALQHLQELNSILKSK